MNRKNSQSAARRYMIRRMRKIRRRQKQKKILVCVLFLLIVAIVCGLLKKNSTETQAPEIDAAQVRSMELAGYLQAAHLTSEETRALLIPRMGETLCVADLDVVLKQLGLWDYREKMTDQILTEDRMQEMTLSREEWTQFYEKLLDEIQVKDTVTETEIQYLGKIPGEQRIQADNGNYDCDLLSCCMEYGKRYVVYVQENLILGIKQELVQTESRDNLSQSIKNSGESITENQKEGVTIPEVPETVRVLLTQDHGEHPERQTVFVSGKSKWKLYTSDEEEIFEPGTKADCGVWMAEHGTTDAVAESTEGGRLCLTDERGEIKGSYEGILHLYREEDSCWVVNELSMENYLYGVVPGEMPASFAPEALKAQAVCARTYAALQVLGTAYEQYHADVDDTTACQVYLPENENQAATDAVNATKGQVLSFQGMLASVYYFSTSCGYTTGLEAWQQEELPYLGTHSLLLDAPSQEEPDAFLRNSQVVAYDSESRFFRWKAVLQTEKYSQKLLEKLQETVNQKNGKVLLTDTDGMQLQDASSLGNLTNMAVSARSDSGCVTDLCLMFEYGTAHVYNENAIRKILWTLVESLMDKNGSTVNTFSILPSAFISIDVKESGNYEIYGGGLGHGIGMSQYGADGMAKSGMDYSDILKTFFPGTVLTQK